MHRRCLTGLVCGTRPHLVPLPPSHANTCTHALSLWIVRRRLRGERNNWYRLQRVVDVLLQSGGRTLAGVCVRVWVHACSPDLPTDTRRGAASPPHPLTHPPRPGPGRAAAPRLRLPRFLPPPPAAAALLSHRRAGGGDCGGRAAAGAWGCVAVRPAARLAPPPASCLSHPSPDQKNPPHPHPTPPTPCPPLNPPIRRRLGCWLRGCPPTPTPPPARLGTAMRCSF